MPGTRVIELVDPALRRVQTDSPSHAVEPEPPPPTREPQPAPDPTLLEEIERLKAVVSVLSFEPLSHGVETREEALYVLGFPPTAQPDKHTLRARFRMLATIYHPDGHFGSHERMAQVNAAMDILR